MGWRDENGLNINTPKHTNLEITGTFNKRIDPLTSGWHTLSGNIESNFLNKGIVKPNTTNNFHENITPNTFHCFVIKIFQYVSDNNGYQDLLGEKCWVDLLDRVGGVCGGHSTDYSTNEILEKRHLHSLTSLSVQSNRPIS